MSDETNISDMSGKNIQEQVESQVEIQTETKKKSNIFLWIVVLVLAITNVLTVVYFIYSKNNQSTISLKIKQSAQEEENVTESIDTDGDGPSDLKENLLGTDKSKKDTDNDGYNDKEEIDKGYDPLVDQGNIDNNKELVKRGKDTILGANDILVEWTEWPGEVSDYEIFDYKELDKLFTEKDVKNMDRMGGTPQTVADFLNTVDVLKVGQIAKGKYQGKELFIVLVSPNGPGDKLLFRIIKNNNELIVLKNYSSELHDWLWYKDLFVENNDINIVNLEPLDRVVYTANNQKISLVKDKQEPNMLMTDVGDFKFLFELDGKKYYKNNLAGCIFTNANDGTVRNYFYDLGFIEKKESATSLAPRHLDITWLNGEKNSNDYIINSNFGCGRAGCYQYADYIKNKDQLKEIGKTSTGDTIYELKDINTKRAKEYSKSILREMFDSAFMGENEGSFDEFVQDHPIVFWQDPFGEFLEFRNAKYQPMAECGKPVIYLYPEEETDVSVYVEPNGGFTMTEPIYNDGWKVKAKPDGELYNYSDKTVYPYLFWEGYAHDYFRPKKGFVVARENVEEFLVEKLIRLGLLEHEYSEFIDFWLPRMQSKPYYFVTFMDQADFDKLAPLTVVPRPDKVIRVFMDYEELDNYIEVEEPSIVTPERDGFTVVEWGGALHR